MDAPAKGLQVSISCIIPAYNEADRIKHVLRAVLSHPDITEVIVIDDGSTDGTSEIAEQTAKGHPAFRLVRQPQNGGKSRAVAAGVAIAQGAHLLFLDSDLVGLRETELSALIAPVRDGRSDVALSLRRNAPRLWHWIGLDYISGERIMPRALLVDHIDRIANLRSFGLEVFLNRLWIAKGLSVAVVRWPNVASPFKAQKYGPFAGIRADLRMLSDMFRTVSPTSAVGQIVALRGLRVSQ